MKFLFIWILAKQWKWNFDLLRKTIIDFNLWNENEFLYTTLKFWFFEILKSITMHCYSLFCGNNLLFSFVEIKQKSIINSSQLYLEI